MSYGAPWLQQIDRAGPLHPGFRQEARPTTIREVERS